MALGLAVLGAAPAHAAQFAATVAGTAIVDDNLFRRPLAARLLAAHDGDLVASLKARLAANGDFGSAAWTAHAAATRTAFRNNGYLNNSSFDIGGTSTYKAESGQLVLSGGLVRQLIPFEDNRLAARGIQSIWRARADGSRSLLGDLRVVAGAGYTRSTNSDALLGLAAYRKIDVSAGLGYYSTAGNILAVQARVSKSHGLNDRVTLFAGIPLIYRADSLDRTIEARLLYYPSTLISVDGRFGYTRHRDDSGLAGDFSGPTGDMLVTWSPRPNVQVKLHADRSFQTASAAFANGVKVSHIDLDLTGSPVDRVVLTLSADRRWRTFRYDIQSPLIGAGRREHITALAGQAVFVASSRVSFNASVTRGYRGATPKAFDYRDTQASVGVAITFGNPAAAG